MTSAVGICNLALAHLGQKSITSLDQDSNEARACNRFYAHERDRLLELHDWNLAEKRQALAEVANARADEWEHAYQRPADCVTFIGIFPDGDAWRPPEANAPLAYQLAAETIYTNAEAAWGVYMSPTTDPAKWSALFADALAWRLAAAIAPTLTEDEKRLRAAVINANDSTAAAIAHDTRQRGARQTYDRAADSVYARWAASRPGSVPSDG